MTAKKGMGIGDVDQSVKHAIAAQAVLNFKTKLAGSLEVYCCACRQPLAKKAGGKALVDYQNWRWKLVDLRWKFTYDEIAALCLPTTSNFFIAGAVCEPCNRTYFEHEKWMGKV